MLRKSCLRLRDRRETVCMSGIQKYREGGGRIDLHLHITNSDRDNTDEVLRLATCEGMRVIALTDHNIISFVELVTVDVS